MEKRKVNRTCCGCRGVFEKKELIRIVRTKEGKVFTDLTGKASGRGAYICRNTECLKKARKSRALERALGEAIPEEAYKKLETEIGSFGE